MGLLRKEADAPFQAEGLLGARVPAPFEEWQGSQLWLSEYRESHGGEQWELSLSSSREPNHGRPI